MSATLFEIASLPDVDAVPRCDEPVRLLERPKPKPRVASAWKDAGGVLERRWGRRVVAQVLYRPDVSRWWWVTEGASGLCTLQWDALRTAEANLRRRKWRLE